MTNKHPKSAATWDPFRRIDFGSLYEGPEKIAHLTLGDNREVVTIPKSCKGAPQDLTDVDGRVEFASEGQDSITLYLSHEDMARGWERIANDPSAPPADRIMAQQFVAGAYSQPSRCSAATAARVLRASIMEEK